MTYGFLPIIVMMPIQFQRLSILLTYLFVTGCATAPLTVQSSESVPEDSEPDAASQPEQKADEEKVFQRKQVAMFSEEQEQLFVTNVTARETARTRDQILQSLHDEKSALRERVFTTLREEFDFEKDGSLSFSAEENALLKRVEDGDPEVVYQFEDEAERARFARLLKLVRQLNQQITVLQSLVNEQEVVVDRTNGNLKRLFNVQPDKRYHYDNQNRILFLLEEVQPES